MSDKETFYDILGVSQTASPDEIKSSYKKLSLVYHPDINKSPKAHEKFLEIKEAYETLIDLDQRSQYDYKLGVNSPPEPPKERKYCTYCKQEISGTAYICNRCNRRYCTHHKHPKDHACLNYHPTTDLRQCHYCGRKIEDMPFKCHRCNEIFCPDHRLPENHGCAQKRIDICHYCKQPIQGRATICSHCKNLFCNIHGTPTRHHCTSIHNNRCRKCGREISWGRTICDDCLDSGPKPNYCRKCKIAIPPGRILCDRCNTKPGPHNITKYVIAAIIAIAIPYSTYNNDIIILPFFAGLILLLTGHKWGFYTTIQAIVIPALTQMMMPTPSPLKILIAGGLLLASYFFTQGLYDVRALRRYPRWLIVLAVAVGVTVLTLGVTQQIHPVNTIQNAGKTAKYVCPDNSIVDDQSQCPLTSTTNTITNKMGCWEYCQNQNEGWMGVCVEDSNTCYPLWGYYSKGDPSCPRNARNKPTYCCCGRDPGFLKILDSNTVPKKDEPQLKQALSSTTTTTRITLMTETTIKKLNERCVTDKQGHRRCQEYDDTNNVCWIDIRTDLVVCTPSKTLNEIPSTTIQEYTYQEVTQDTEQPSTQTDLTGEKTVKLNYVLRGSYWQITYPVYYSLNEYLKGLPRWYYGTPTQTDIELKYLNDERQKQQLEPLLDTIRKGTNNPDDQARIAISLAQQIPYDYDRYNSNTFDERYPYQVIYDNKGVCGEKAKLAVYLLRELGYGTVLFSWEGQHEAAGVKCPQEISYKSTGYCFLEVANPIIPTEKPRTYGLNNEITLSDNPEVIHISDGKQLDLTQEYQDAKKFEQIQNMGQVLPPEVYNQYMFLANKYGIKFETT